MLGYSEESCFNSGEYLSKVVVSFNFRSIFVLADRKLGLIPRSISRVAARSVDTCFVETWSSVNLTRLTVLMRSTFVACYRYILSLLWTVDENNKREIEV